MLLQLAATYPQHPRLLGFRAPGVPLPRPPHPPNPEPAALAVNVGPCRPMASAKAGVTCAVPAPPLHSQTESNGFLDPVSLAPKFLSISAAILSPLGGTR